GGRGAAPPLLGVGGPLPHYWGSGGHNVARRSSPYSPGTFAADNAQWSESPPHCGAGHGSPSRQPDPAPRQYGEGLQCPRGHYRARVKYNQPTSNIQATYT